MSTGSKLGYDPKENELQRIPRLAAFYISNFAKTKCIPVPTNENASIIHSHLRPSTYPASLLAYIQSLSPVIIGLLVIAACFISVMIILSIRRYCRRSEYTRLN